MGVVVEGLDKTAGFGVHLIWSRAMRKERQISLLGPRPR